MKVAVITDTHWGVRGDSRVFYRHFRKFYEERFFPEVERQGIRQVLHCGDLVERRKFINFETLYYLRDLFLDRIEALGLTLHCVVGNHDIYYRNSNRLSAASVLFRDSDRVKVYPEYQEVEFGGTEVALIPWINDENREETLRKISSSRCQVAFGHLDVSGFSMYRDSVPSEGMDPSVFSRFEMVYSGHYHHPSTKGNIRYLGSPYETTWSDYNDDRGFHVFDSETRSMEFIRNPDRIFFKILYDGEPPASDFSHLKDKYVKVIVRKKDNEVLFSQMIDRIESVGPADLDVVEDHHHKDVELIQEGGGSEDTETLMREYVDKGSFKKKDELKRFLSEIMVEAQDDQV